MSRFEELVNRRGTCCVKWDGHSRLGIPEEAIPLWVADMDFKTVPQVTEAIEERSRHEVYGYAMAMDSYYKSIQGWMKRRHNWEIQSSWVIPMPGVVPAVNLAINTFTEKGDAVLIQQPVYHPFANAIRGNQRKLVNNSLILKDNGKYGIDFKDFEQKIVENQVKLFILCSPHNPVGRVWTQEELQKMGDICLKYNVLIVSDEIHQDLAFPGHRHYPLPTIDPKFDDITIVCTAPSKTFNLAGLQAANIIISNPKLRKEFKDAATFWGLAKINSFGLVACEAAYNHGDQWLDEAIEYIQGNMEFVKEFLETRLPKIKLIVPEGLFLLWLDFSGLELSSEELNRLLTQKAGLWLIQGEVFGEPGLGYARLNAACSRTLLKTALEQLEQAINSM